MMPEHEQGASAAAETILVMRQPRGKARAETAGESGTGEKPVARIMQLVAALKAEQETASVEPLAAVPQAAEPPAAEPPAAEPSERVKLMSSLRDILTTREQERAEWKERLRELRAQFAQSREQERAEWAARLRALEVRLVEAQVATEAARAVASHAEAQHGRVVGDLKLLHEHQRSIWQLERRRLEITIDGLEQAQRQTLGAKAARLLRPALLAGLVLVALAAVALSGDSGAAPRPPVVSLDDDTHAAAVPPEE